MQTENLFLVVTAPFENIRCFINGYLNKLSTFLKFLPKFPLYPLSAPCAIVSKDSWLRALIVVRQKLHVT